MTSFHRGLGSLTLAGAFLLGGAACSSSSKSAAPAPTSAAAASTSAAPGEGGSSSTVPAKTGSGGDKTAFCAEVKAIAEDPALQGDTSTGAAFVKAKAAYAKLAASAPSVVKADIVYLSDYLSAISAAGKDATKQAATAKKFTTKVLTDHSDNLTRFVTQSCGNTAAG